MINTPQMQSPQYQAALSAFASGTITDADRSTLQGYLTSIAQNATGDDAVQSRDIVQALSINHFILQRHIDELEGRGAKTQALVVALTVASLVGTAAQFWLAYRADGRSEQEVRAQLVSPTPPARTELAVPFQAPQASANSAATEAPVGARVPQK